MSSSDDTNKDGVLTEVSRSIEIAQKQNKELVTTLEESQEIHRKTGAGLNNMRM